MWLTNDLVSAVRRSAFMPTVDDLVDSTRGQFSDAEILAFADEEQPIMGEMLRGLADESRIAYLDTPCTGGALTIQVPVRAMMRAVRRVHYIDSSGVEQPEIEPVEPADAVGFGADFVSRPFAPFCWYFEADTLRLPATPTAGSVRVYYITALPRMVLTSECVAIVGKSGALTATTNETPTWLAASERIDVVRGSSPFPTLDTDLVVASFVPDTSVTLTTWPAYASVSTPGTLTTVRTDYICAAQSSCYVPLPQEWHSALIACVVVRVLEAIGDEQALGGARARMQRALATATAAAAPRNSGRSEKIVNRSSPLRSRARWRSW